MAACIPDLQAFRLRAGDTLLCCDGLWNMVAAEQIAAAVQGAPLEHACTTLIELAKEAGGEDNISLILLTVRSGK
jgi:protein phosphatase